MRQTAKSKGCPVCGKPQTVEHMPFCSPGCRNRDLLKWLGEGYRIPGPPADEPSSLARVDSEEGEG